MNILLVEDEANIASMVCKGLTEDGYTVSVAPDGNIGLQMSATHPYDLYIIDIMLPGINGLELCRQIRKTKNKHPILMLTALGTTENIVTGFEYGADDYMVKPFKFAELRARIRALIRRSSGHTEENKLRIASLELDQDAKRVKREDNEIILTSTEYRLLEYLLKNQGKVVSRMDLLENVWGVDFNMATNVVDVYVNYLRKNRHGVHNENRLAR
jgi:DNA-binding response OmpR family regulator